MFRIIPDGISYTENVLLKNGKGIFLKPASISDKQRVTDFMSRLSQDSLRMRFMASVSQVSEKVIDELCHSNFIETGCLLAINGEDPNSKVVGLANYISIGNNRAAEVAFLVEDKYQGLGISTILLERLAGIAAANGIIEFEAEVLPENQQMINVFKSSGFNIHKVWDSDTIHIEFPVDGAASLWKRTALRERIAVANSLIPLLKPKIIAVIGVERDLDCLGNIIFKNILTGNFTGTVYPISMTSPSVHGVKTYKKITEIEDKIDLAIITIKSESVFEAARESIEAGAKAIVVVSTGFAESGIKGKERQKKLVKLVRSHGVRLLGPSCLGLINTDPEINLNASLLPQLTKYGNIGLFAHSAALGLVILEYAKSLGLSFTTFVSAGNRADVSGNDFLQYWEEDPQTEIVILYLETFGNPRKFVRIARNMSYKKPILCVKSASSAVGRKTVEAKIGSKTGSNIAIDALFQQTGIILAPTLEELFDTAIILQHQPLPKNEKVGIIANSAGMLTIFADNCEAYDLSVSNSSLINLGAFASSQDYKNAVKKLLLDEEVSALFVGFASVGKDISKHIVQAIKDIFNEKKGVTKLDKPILLCLMGNAGAITTTEESLDKKKIVFPSFRFPESAVRALSRIVRYSNFRNIPPGKIVWYNDVKADSAREIVKELVHSSNDIIIVDKNHAINILDYFGIICTKDSSNHSEKVTIKVKPDVLFGPLIEISISGIEKIVRITPLTENDLDEIFRNIKNHNFTGLKQIVGRVSQLIEELPWLHSVFLEHCLSEVPQVTENIEMKIIPHNIKRPTY